ncbi:phage tail protein [Dickeya fangzhongdai]|uniref:phage tail protein n=1 Tax=Dickeya fangzhongdai TaxID=1778540 RepID=UPI003307A5F8
MTTKYFALLTTTGAALLANATALGRQLQITQMALGDGGGTLPTPDPAQTKLVNERRRAPLNSLSVDPANPSQIIAEQVIPEDEGGWWIREIGLYDANGNLIAVANCPETYKPQLQEGSGRVQTVRMILIVSSTDAVTLKIDPSVVLATRAYADGKATEAKTYSDIQTNSAKIEVKAYVDNLINHAATTMAASLAEKMDKTRNGADIADVARFLENIGLTEPRFSGVVGASRNAKMSIAAVSVTATFTADEIIVGESLGGRQYRLGSFKASVNLTTTGPGGMDTGTVPTVGFVALYAIYNPASNTSALLAVEATSAVSPEIYAGSNMPADYTASALVSVWRVSSSRFVVGYQSGRHITIMRSAALSSTTQHADLIPLSLAGLVPPNAHSVNGDGYTTTSDGSTVAVNFSIASSATGINRYSATQFGSLSMPFSSVAIIDAQTVYYTATIVSGALTMAINVSGYEI